MCWAIVIASLLEALEKLFFGRDVSLSESYVFDSTYPQTWWSKLQKRNATCSGKSEQAIAYVKDNGIVYAKDYPVIQEMRKKKYDIPLMEKVQIKSYKLLQGVDANGNFDEDALMREVYLHPVIAAMNGIDDDRYLYNNDKTIYKGYPDTRSYFDHQILVIGFGRENGVKYWVVRDSAGPDWGDGGNIRVAYQSPNGVPLVGCFISVEI